MNSRALQYLGMASLVCGIAFCADEAWTTKDPSQWNGEEINKILNDSPWAKRTKVTFDRSATGDQGRSGRSGGPTWGGRGGGIGFPGGGGMGGARRGGMGGGPGGQRRQEGQNIPPVEVVMRWETAVPVREALARHPDTIQLEDAQADRAKETKTPADANSYVIALIGLRLPERRARRSDRNDDDRDSQTNQDSDRLRDRLMSSARLAIKGRGAIRPSDVKVNTEYGNSDVRFYFSRTNSISLDDKDVTFECKSGGMKLEQKFHVKDMQYQGKLTL